MSKTLQGKKIVVEVLGPGEIFGEMAFIDPAPRSATATAFEPTVVELVDRDFLDGEFNQMSSDFREVLYALVKRLKKTTQALVDHSPRRTEKRLGVNIRISFKSPSELVKAYIRDLSGGGLFIATGKHLPVGSPVNLEFNLPNGNESIRTKGRVAWTRPNDKKTEPLIPGMGIEFIDLSPEGKKLITRYLALHGSF